MKRIISIIILVLALSFIGIITTYTLSHRGVRPEIEPKSFKQVEKITSNFSNSSLTEIYNVYLNKEKHKLKLEYTFIKKEKSNSSIELFIYLDGKVIFDEEIISNNKISLSKVFESDEFSSVQIEKEHIKIIKFENQDYLLIDIRNLDDYIKEKYYLYDSLGKSYIEDGLLVLDSSVYYENNNKEVQSIFYDVDNQVLAKYENNVLYTLEYNESKEQLLEYEYIIKNNQLEKKLINTYDSIVLKKNNKNNK